MPNGYTYWCCREPTPAPEEPTVEFHSTPQLWVAYYCGCSGCPKGLGKTKEAAVAALLEDTQSGNDRAQNGQAATNRE